MGLTLTRGEMLDRLTRHYNLSELRQLCFELNVPYEELAGETRSDKAISLIEWLERRERLPDLVARLEDRIPVSPHQPPPPDQPPEWSPIERNTQPTTRTPPDTSRLTFDASRFPYHPLFLRLFPGETEGVYRAELSSPELGLLPDGTLQLNLAELAAADAETYGRRLGEALFGEQGALRDAYRQAQTIFAERKWLRQLRLRLEAEELESLRWERLQHQVGQRWYPLATAADPLFSRFIPTGEGALPAPLTGPPLRLLLVIASPPDLAQRGLDPISPEERQALHALFAALPGMEVTCLESGTARPPTVAALRAALLEGYPLFHLVCHGRRKQGETELYLEDRPVQTQEVLELFHGLAERPRLVFLAACESAARGRAEAFLPLGPALVAEGGISAVVAMADRVGLTTARDFAAAFYTSLLTHGLVDRAAQEARLSVRDRMDWSVPVLFSRLPDNRLWVETTTNGRGAAVRPNAPPTLSTSIPPDPLPVSLGDLRRQLNQRFDDAELDAFCLDHFPAVYDKFGRGQRKDEKINLLLDHCRRWPEELARLVMLLSAG